MSYDRREIDCPKCGNEAHQDSVDIGVGVMYGPNGCPSCGWSEDEQYDVSGGRKYTEKGYMLDQFGGATPPSGYGYIPPISQATKEG